jgi:hypothetical protein
MGYKQDLEKLTLSREKYFAMYRKIWAIMRYEINKEMKETGETQ